MSKSVQKIQPRTRRSMKRQKRRGGSKYPSGVCRVCRCTHYAPCAEGCAWADKAETLCTVCAVYMEDVKTPIGQLFDEYGPRAVLRLVNEAILEHRPNITLNTKPRIRR